MRDKGVAILSLMKRYSLLVIAFVGAVLVLLSACTDKAIPVSNVTVAPTEISPNGDGQADLARFSYKVSQPTQVSIYLTDASGKRYSLRENVERLPSPEAYELLFNGVSNGRLIPNGDYTWHVDAMGVAGLSTRSGPFKIVDANLPFPQINEFTLSTNTFSPKRDGINDHVYINVVTTHPAKLTVYVTPADDANAFRYEVQRTEGLRTLTSDGELPAGRYNYDYDGGIYLGADPPPDGDYVMVAESEDRIGQRDTVTAPLKIVQSGRPVAEIVTQPDGSSVTWSAGAGGQRVARGPTDYNLITMGISDTLYFTVAVKNVGLVPIRTAGPFDPNDCYRMEQNLYSKGYVAESGAFRVGINYDTNPGMDHPWRWGIGSLSDLDVVMHDGQKLYYLAPGKQVVVSGCIKMTVVPPRNPFNVYASLIQEDVEILAINFQVSPVRIQLVKP
jgi:hypothetical protein